MNLIPSANGCNRPNGPTLVGPQRFWIRADTFRSSHTLYATAVSSTKTTAADLTTEMMAKVRIFNDLSVILFVWSGHTFPLPFAVPELSVWKPLATKVVQALLLVCRHFCFCC